MRAIVRQHSNKLRTVKGIRIILVRTLTDSPATLVCVAFRARIAGTCAPTWNRYSITFHGVPFTYVFQDHDILPFEISVTATDYLLDGLYQLEALTVCTGQARSNRQK
jgi:hypothetical protein